jgi:hypothetical protein
MASPPSPLDVNDTTAALLPPPTPVMLGAAGAVAATNELEAADGELLPVAFVATTVHVYVFEFDNDDTVIGEDPCDPDRVVPPSLEVQVAV